MNLAFYGTLRDPEVLHFVGGEDLISRFYAAFSLKGWESVRIEGTAYPLLRRAEGGATVFHLYHDCSEVSWRRLIAYEGEEYHWIELFIDDRTYRVFMAEPSAVASSELWNLETFQTRDKSLYLNLLKDDLSASAARS